jgi:Protein of unknown function (DUF4085)
MDTPEFSVFTQSLSYVQVSDYLNADLQIQKSSCFEMIYFKRKVLYPPKGDQVSPNRFDKAFRDYREHLESIRSKLPESAWRLACLSFHDAKVLALAQPRKNEIEITLDSAGYHLIQQRWLKVRTTRLLFSDVRKFWVPPSIVADFWLYEEMHLSDLAAFDYQVMMAKDEIRIQANEVDIFTAA